MQKYLIRKNLANEWLANYEAKAVEEGNKVKEEFGEDTTYLSFLASGGQFLLYLMEQVLVM